MVKPEEPSFESSIPFEKRKAEVERLREKYVDRVPVIVEKAASSQKMPSIDKKKYLVPESMTFGQFIHVIRKRVKLAPEQAIFVFVNNVLPPSAATMGQIYAEHKDECGYLMAQYSGENSFGCEYKK